jgi:hypothetical protein
MGLAAGTLVTTVLTLARLRTTAGRGVALT